PPGKDFTAWDLATILKEISRHFDLALAAEKKLKETPVSAYRDFLVEGVAPDNYRPTLFDIIAYSALEFYTSGEQAGAKAEDAFELSAESPVLSEAKEFLRWQPVTSDTDSSIYRAVLLYQKLLAFHQNDTDKTAFLDADLHRLNFGYNQAFGEEKKSRYQAALKKFIEQWADHEVSAMARFHLASLLKEDNELVQAHELARQGYQAFPESAGGRWCYNLMKQIEARSVSIQTERVWNEPWPSISVTYRNINKVFFRVIPADFQGRLKLDTWQPEGLTDKEFKEIRNQKPLQEWSASLPATSDYRERTEQVPVPQSLPPGFYFILASHQPTFTDQDNQVSVAAVWVSRLALVVRSGARESGVEGFVLTAREGEPLAGASVQVWQRDYQDRFWKQLDTVKTDRNGFFQYRDSKLSRQYLLLAFYKDDCLASAPNYVYRGGKVASSFSRTVLFTDRALYRPGQIISYKGICFQVDQEKNNYRVLSENTLTVVFRDVNGKEISRQEKKTNQYGSFSGSFVAPSDRLTGRMTIQVEVGPSGSVAINVEEYKRPKFQVTLELPEKPVRLDEKVTLRGKAVAYTGAPIGAAKVKYRVVREVCWPVWYRWYYWWPREPVQSQEIAHGLTTTDSDGSFTLTFLARPDRSVSQKQQAYFTFRVNADVTDITGETRSGQRMINLGYASLQARMTAEEWQTVEKPAEITINTATLDGQSQPATGVVKIYLLKQPEKVVRSELVGTRWSYYRKAADFSAADPSDPNCWKEEEVVQEIPFTTDGTGSTKISAKLPAGIYRAILETKDSFGTPVSCFLPLQVLDLKASKYQVRRPHVFIASRWSVEVGQTFLALWGTGYPSGQAYIEIEHRGKILQAYWTSPEKTQAVIEQAVTEEMRGGFSVRVTYVRENRAYLESRTVDVPWSNQNLSVKWERFVSKLEPGAREKWSAVITGPEAEKVVAEMVAALYDASLDAYLPHDWVTSFSQYFYKERSTIQSRFENSMVAFHHLFGYWPVDYKPAGWNYRRFPDEVVSNLRGYGFLRQAAGANAKGMEMAPLAAMAMEGSDRAMVEKSAARADALQEERKKVGEAEPSAPATVDLSKVNPRKNLNETAFFFPHLVSDENGVVRMEFTMPEAMTEWKFLSFAHDRKLRSGFLTDRVVTAKELMVEPNPPRFLREGDLIEFVVKISNQSPTRQTGKVRLNLQEARTLKNVDQSLGNTRPEQTFDLPAGESGRYSWRLTVPEGTDFLIYQAVASTGRLSDGEEGYLPVIPQKVLVTESLPLPIRGPATRKFFFKSLLESAKSSTLRHQSLTVQMASNPAWYAVMALPYLMEYPYECVEQSFNRLYANALARTIVQSDPKIKRVFEQWKGTDALDSPLEKNQELKGVMLEETPWLR
ncbi:MAG TPA: alpha-2-macroglobulin family protein, partial [bacterium]|nr:alpha-2-macroglobulin family protein [bacterium]